MGRRSRVRRSALAALPMKRNTSIADAIKTRVARYYLLKMRQCFFELGLCRGGRLRADVLAIAMNGHIVIVEVKSSVADFRADKKFREYEPYCCQLYFAMPESVWLKVKADIPKQIGVFVMGEDGTVIKRVCKASNYDMDPETERDLMIRALFRSADTNVSKSKVKT